VILLDTNVVSELMREKPASKVLAWAGALRREDCFTSSITEAEIFHGIGLLPAGQRRRKVEAAAEEMFAEDFSGRVLPFDSMAARGYARLVCDTRRRGTPMSQFDAQIAAIAQAAGATLATRNVKDFRNCELSVIDPWLDA
jgi:toxin FitB